MGKHFSIFFTQGKKSFHKIKGEADFDFNEITLCMQAKLITTLKFAGAAVAVIIQESLLIGSIIIIVGTMHNNSTKITLNPHSYKYCDVPGSPCLSKTGLGSLSVCIHLEGSLARVLSWPGAKAVLRRPRFAGTQQ